MSTFEPTTRVLLVCSDSPRRAVVEDLLARGSFTVRHAAESDVATGDVFMSDEADAILLEASPGAPEPVAAFSILERYRDLPVILFAQKDDRKLAARMIQAGVQDLVVLEGLTPPALQRCLLNAIERHRQISELRFALASEKILMEELDKKNKELVELSITDGLTGLYNHRFLQERFDFEFKRAKRYGSPLCCFLIDIDHFKQVNDTYGHQFGDFVLIELARILKNGSREVDICGRYGGEEFMVVSSIDATDAMRFASKLHSTIDEFRFTQGEQTIHMTVSIGVAEYHGDVKTRQQLIERADTALYWAKRDGRNLIRLWKEIEEDDAKTLDQYSIEGLKTEFMRLSQQVRVTYMESTDALVRAIDAKDHYTQEHSKNVSEYAVMLARGMKFPEREVEVVKHAGLLHDIGKIGISQEVLTKEGKVTDEEFAILKKHPVIGANIVRDVKFLEKEVPIILHHHERWDGRGYPHGLKGREIPLGARILAVVDAYDAMTTNRVYRRKLLEDEAVAELVAGRNTQFDAEIVDVFVDILKNRQAGT